MTKHKIFIIRARGYIIFLWFAVVTLVELDLVDSLNIELPAARNCGATDRSLGGAERRHGGGTSADFCSPKCYENTAAVFQSK